MVGALLAATAMLVVAGGEHEQSSAADLEGSSRVSAVAGWRYTTNALFASRAREAGTPLVRASSGGPQVTASFGYSPKSFLELAIDLFAGGEQLQLEGRGRLTSVTYGLNVGLRLQTLLAGAWVPSIGIGTGPTLVYVRGAGLQEPRESVTNGYVASAGLTRRLTDTLGLHLDVRLFLATRGEVPGLLSINGGGLWSGVGLTYTFPRERSERPSSGIGW